MIWYRHPSPNAPKLHWNMPFISEADKAELSKEHPKAVPAHCLPWIAGQSAGLVIPWTGSDILLKFDDNGLIHKDLPKDLPIHSFAEGHFSIQPGYFLHTQENVGIYIISASNIYNLEAVHGVVETDWYPMMPFFVFKNLEPYSSMKLEHGMPIAQVVPIVLDKGLAEMNDDQFTMQINSNTDYYKERLARKDLLWVSAKGQGFSRLYKLKQRAKKRGNS